MILKAVLYTRRKVTRGQGYDMRPRTLGRRRLQMNVRMHSEILDGLRARAQADGTNVSDVVETALVAYLEAKMAEPAIGEHTSE